MSERDDLIEHFGPFLFEALVRILVEELNRLRSQLGMPLITKENFFTEINNDLSHLEPYEWMDF